jgi:hypothetical protein
MSGHADTIRSALLTATFEHSATRSDVDDALDALVAENQRLRDALEQISDWGALKTVWAHHTDAKMSRLARAALAGTPSEDTR